MTEMFVGVLPSPFSGQSAQPRTVAVLRSMLPLLASSDPERADDKSAIDEALLHFLQDLSDATVLAVAPDVMRVGASLPLLYRAVTERCRSVLQRIATPTADDGETSAMPIAIERRTQPRNPIADADHPLTRARQAPADELMRLAAMPAMPERMADILTSRVHLPAIVAALRNPSAVFGPSSLLMLAELAAGDRSLRDALVDYPRLSDAAATRLIPILPRDACARLVVSGTSPAEVMRVEDAAGEVSVPFDALASLGGALTIATALAVVAPRAEELLGVSRFTAKFMLCARLDHAAAVLLRALGALQPALHGILAMRAREGLRLAAGSQSADAVFARIDAAEAQALVRVVDERLAAQMSPALAAA